VEKMSVTPISGCICPECKKWHDVIFYDKFGKAIGCLRCKYKNKFGGEKKKQLL
jgi:hypothetical protein